jgi:hypothetical protein
MSVERFPFGTLYRGVIDPRTALQFGHYSRAFRRYDPTLFFEPPINKAVGLRGVKKAWLDYPDGTKNNRAIAKDYIQITEDPTDWCVKAASAFVALCDLVDEITETPSHTRFLQSYAPGTVLATHDDKGISSRIVGLSGAGEFRMHDSVNHDRVTDVVVIGPGDIFHFMANGLHSAINPSVTDYRETVNLIDIVI